MDDSDEEPTLMTQSETEIRELLGLFDIPAFARRGQELEYALARIHARSERERATRLEMVRLRLRQWAGAVTGPNGWQGIFEGPIDVLRPMSGAEPPTWGRDPALPRRKRALARDLVASIERFNRRWNAFLDAMSFEFINRLIDQYNRYYLLEKECSLGSARLAARHFTPKPHVTLESIREQFPVLPVPRLARSR
jgi:hypothetical protein